MRAPRLMCDVDAGTGHLDGKAVLPLLDSMLTRAARLWGGIRLDCSAPGADKVRSIRRTGRGDTQQPDDLHRDLWYRWQRALQTAAWADSGQIWTARDVIDRIVVANRWLPNHGALRQK